MKDFKHKQNIKVNGKKKQDNIQTFTAPLELINETKQYCKDNNIFFSSFIAKAVAQLLDECKRLDCEKE